MMEKKAEIIAAMAKEKESIAGHGLIDFSGMYESYNNTINHQNTTNNFFKSFTSSLTSIFRKFLKFLSKKLKKLVLTLNA